MIQVPPSVLRANGRCPRHGPVFTAAGIVKSPARPQAAVSRKRPGVWAFNPASTRFSRVGRDAGNIPDAKFTVHHTGSSTQVIKNQTQNGAQWNSLGIFTLDATSSVELSNRSSQSGKVIADAINLVSTGGLETYYIHSDQLTTPTAITDSGQNIVWSAEYDPFGSAQVVGSMTFNLRFPGQYFNQESGLHYNWHRYYDPATGRYVTSDPIGLRGGLNTYGHVFNNPLKWIDSKGLSIDDLRYIFNQMRTMFPEISARGRIWIGGLDDPINNVAETDPVSGDMLFREEYRKKNCLSKDEWINTFYTMFHEGMHSTDGFFERWISFRHSSIYAREMYERGGTISDPPWIIWGSPNLETVDDDALYKEYLQSSPDCKCWLKYFHAKAKENNIYTFGYIITCFTDRYVVK